MRFPAPHRLLLIFTLSRVFWHFRDECEYFLIRKQRWVEPPILYAFISDVLQNPNKRSEEVIPPLLSLVESLCLSAKGEGEGELQGVRGGAGKRKATIVLARACCALESLLGGAFGAVDATQASEIARVLATPQAQAAMAADARQRIRQALLRDMAEGEEGGVHTCAGLGFAAHVHERGCPRWGPLRPNHEAAARDRKVLKRAAGERRLAEALETLK